MRECHQHPHLLLSAMSGGGVLDRVTITGADDNVDPLVMLDLSLAHPYLEWGILASRSREGSPRYPSRQWQEELLRVNREGRMNLAMHVCGKWARGIFAGTVEWRELPPIRTVVQRIQINGTPPGDVTSVYATGACNPGTQFIVQHPRAAEYLLACKASNINCAPLFDDSGGGGLQVRAWSGMPDYEYVGYAGGVGEPVRKIIYRPRWDVEGDVRPVWRV